MDQLFDFEPVGYIFIPYSEKIEMHQDIFDKFVESSSTQILGKVQSKQILGVRNPLGLEVRPSSELASAKRDCRRHRHIARIRA